MPDLPTVKLRENLSADSQLKSCKNKLSRRPDPADPVQAPRAIAGRTVYRQLPLASVH